ncbi:MAG TPA: caspase family protein [Pyrinomonadaceae bacterium]|nr:caspase family protein [Pyrinomonadaceae bacterium]
MRSILVVKLIALFAVTAFAQNPTPSPTPTDQRGLGIQSNTANAGAQSGQQSREAKPELVLQTGYNNFYGATRLTFSPDGRLLATTTFRSNTIKLWETGTGRKLRDLSSSGQSAPGIAPFVAFSRDSRLVAAAGPDASVKVWDVTSGRELQTLAGPQGSMSAAIGVYFIAFAANNQLVTVSDSAKVWDLNTGRELRSLQSQTMPVVSGFNGTDGGMVLSPDGTQLAIASDDSDPHVSLIDISSGRENRSVKLPDDQIESLQLAFTADGRLLASGVVKRHFKLWDLTSKKEQDVAPTTKDYPQVKFSRDGRLLALSDNYNIRIWEVATMRELPGLKLPNSGAYPQGDAFVGFSEDGKRIATGGFVTETTVWETETGKQVAKLSGRTNLAYSVAFNADGTLLYSGDRTRWDLRTGRGFRVAARPVEMTFGIPSPDGRMLAVMRPNSNALSLLETPSGRELSTLTPSGETGPVQRVRFSADGTMLAITYGQVETQHPTAGSFSRGSQVKIWDVKNSRELRSLATGELPAEAEFSGDGRTIGTIGSMGQIALWDAQSGNKRELTSSPMAAMQNMGKIKPGQMPNMTDIAAMMTNVLGTMSAGTMGRSVTSLAFSPDGKTLATGGVESKANIDIAAMMSGAMNPRQKKGSKQPDPADMMRDLKVEAVGQVQLWDVASGREVGALKGHSRGVTKVVFSRDGKLLASGASDNTIRIWDVEAQRELRTLVGHTSPIESMAFTPDGRLLASASDDGSTFLWDTRSGEHLLTLISLDDGAEWMVVTPQGLFDGTPISWNQILWRYNQDTFNVAPIEWFFNEFYYPGLLADVFNGKRPRVAQDVSKKDRRQPVVKLSLVGPSDPTIASRTVKVKIDVADAPADKDNPKGSGAQDVRLFRNGSLVKVWHGDVLKGESAVSLEEEITVTAGTNHLVAYAFNRDNVKSKDAPLVFAGADSLKRKGTAYIIAVGVNEYANSQYNLKYAVADARSFADEVRRKQTQIAGFERVEVIELLDANATKENILSVIRRLAGEPGPPTLKAGDTPLKRAEPEDTVIIYYAGHGTAQQQRFYLIPHDLGYTGDRTKLSEAGLKTILSHSISDIDLETAVEGLDAGHLLLIIDACNSGQALEAEEKRRGPMNSKGLAQLAYEKGMYILTAAQSFQAALEAAQLGHGYLTYALVEEGLKTPVADAEPKDGVLIAREWLDFATERVPRMQEEKMANGRGLGIAFTEGEADVADPQKRTVQRPRVFYRRELEANPLIIAKP